jgi:hypothetical protein
MKIHDEFRPLKGDVLDPEGHSVQIAVVLMDCGLLFTVAFCL